MAADAAQDRAVSPAKVVSSPLSVMATRSANPPDAMSSTSPRCTAARPQSDEGSGLAPLTTSSRPSTARAPAPTLVQSSSMAVFSSGST